MYQAAFLFYIQKIGDLYSQAMSVLDWVRGPRNSFLKVNNIGLLTKLE